MTRYSVSNSAIVVVDVQNDFCHPDGYQSRLGRDVTRTHGAVSRLTELLDAARVVDVPIVLMRNEHDSSAASAEWLDRHSVAREIESCAVGSWGAEFFRLEPQPGDIVLSKSRYSAFVGSQLEPVLRRLGRTSLFFCGVTTSICVESSLRDAVCRDFFGTLVEDCCGDYSEAVHLGAMSSVSGGFGRVLSAPAVLAAWSEHRADGT